MWYIVIMAHAISLFISFPEQCALHPLVWLGFYTGRKFLELNDQNIVSFMFVSKNRMCDLFIVPWKGNPSKVGHRAGISSCLMPTLTQSDPLLTIRCLVFAHFIRKVNISILTFFIALYFKRAILRAFSDFMLCYRHKKLYRYQNTSKCRKYIILLLYFNNKLWPLRAS